MEIIFLKAKQKLVKEITTDETKPYPLVKNFTSEHYNIEPNQEGFDKFYELLQTHAAAGHALHKGDLKKKLKNESRALMTDRAASTQSLVLDLDGITFPGAKSKYNTYDIQNIAEAFVQYLPSNFSNVSYIAQASASLGMKSNKISMHLFFLLNHTVQPRALKEWFRTLNYEVDILGYKCYMIDIMASICLTQMKKLPKNLEWRRHIQKRYNEELADCITAPPHSETVQYYCAKVPPEHRDNLIDYLASKNIHTSVHFKPLHKYNVVKSMNQREYPVADVEWKKLISLPCHPGMNDEDIDYVMYWVREFFAGV